MPLWSVAYDPEIDGPRFRARAGFGHALLASALCFAFDDLGVSASLWEPGQGWLPLRIHAEVVRFEVEHGVEGRNSYNERCLAHVLSSKKTVVGNYQGYSDLFVPVLFDGDVEAVVVTGPFLRKRPTSGSILEHWRRLTGRQGQLTDPEFAWYFATLQRVLVLEGRQAHDFQKLVECLARLLSGRGNAEKDANRASVLRARLGLVRFVDRMWDVVRIILDERSAQTWFSMYSTVELRRLGLTRVADQVLVGLASFVAPNRASSDDPVDQAVRRDELQRACVWLARQMGELLVGQVGDRGVVFLSATSGSAQRKRQRLVDVVERASKIARTLGFSLHFAALPATSTEPLGQCYLRALALAESAFTRGERLVMADAKSVRDAPSLRELRAQLGSVGVEETALFEARFGRYLEAVIVRYGDHVETARAHLEVVFDSLADPLLRSGALDRRTLGTLCEALDRAAANARNVDELIGVYRRAARDLVEAVEHPVQARRDRSLRVAIEYIHQHYTEPLRISQVARVAGFAPGHFSKLFIRREDMPFERYVRALRLERARHLLADTDLDTGRIAELSGFGTAQYLSRVFRKEVGATPLGFRKLPKKYWPERFESPKKKTRKSKVDGSGIR